MVKFKKPILLGLKKTIAHSFPISPVLFKQDKTEKYCSLDFKKQSLTHRVIHKSCFFYSEVYHCFNRLNKVTAVKTSEDLKKGYKS